MKNLSILLSLVLIGCSTYDQQIDRMNPNFYSYNQSFQPNLALDGRILSINPVTVELKQSKNGLVIGAIIGAVAGNYIGGGEGIYVGIGTLLGGIVGDSWDRQRVRTVEAQQIIVEITDREYRPWISHHGGNVISIIQKDPESTLLAGQSVFLLTTDRFLFDVGSEHRFRIIPKT